MGLSPQLEAQLQNARLGLLLPVLRDLGVECCGDLKFINEGDIGGRQDISLIMKRRFLEWRDKMQEPGDNSSSEAESECSPRQSQLLDLTQEVSMRNANKALLAASPKASARTSSSIDHSTAASTTFSRQQPPIGSSHDMPMPSLPTQTPRTRAMPFVDVLRELENLDIALKEERERGSNLVEEKEVLEQNHARDMKMLEEMLQHAYAEIEGLKSTIAAHQMQGGGKHTFDERRDDAVLNQFLNEERVTFAPRDSVTEDDNLAWCEPRESVMEDEPEMEQ